MGFFQQELADYLGIDRTQLSRWEMGHRGLPYEAGYKWSNMLLCLYSESEASAEATASMEQQQRADLTKFMAQEINKCRRKPELQRRLEAMQADYQQCLRTLAFVTRLRESGGTMLPNERLNLNCAEARARKKIWDCGLVKQAQLSIQLQALTATEQELQTFNHVFFNQ